MHRFIISGVILLLTTAALAHHSPFLYFNPASEVSAEGTISSVRWRNPHAVFKLDAVDESGNVVSWTLETHSVSILRRMKLSRDIIKVGDKVKAIGWPAKRAGNEMFMINLLLADGREVVFHPGAPPRFSDEVEGDPAAWLITDGSLPEYRSEDTGIFHVWSTTLVEGEKNLLFEGYDFPLTESAAAVRDGFDIYSNPIIDSCEFKGMPTIMEQPYPMELTQGEGVITMRMEEGDSVRTFDMSPDADYSGNDPRPMGYSTGKWEGDTLVVTTSGADWPYIDMTGVPNSPDAVYVERFTPTSDGTRLDYTMTATHPEVLTRPVTFEKYWLWVPGEVVRPYECETDQE